MVVVRALAVAAVAAAALFFGIPSAQATLFIFNTGSSAEVDVQGSTTSTITNTQVSFITQIVGQLGGQPYIDITNFGSFAANLSTTVPFIESQLAAAGAVSFTGPTLLSSDVIEQFFPTTQTVRTTTLLTGTRQVEGPGAVAFGDFGICQSFSIGSGAEFTGTYALVSGCTGPGQILPLAGGLGDTDEMTLSLVTIDTFISIFDDETIVEKYVINGNLPETAAVAEPASLAIFALSLGFLAWAGARRKSL